MSVMACGREGCDHILCDLYNPEYGYICGRCFNELQYFILIHGGVVTDELIKEFLQTPISGTRFEDHLGHVRESLKIIFPFPDERGDDE